MAIRRVIVGSRAEATVFEVDEPYAVISFVGFTRYRTPPRLMRSPNYVGRIVIRADDVLSDNVWALSAAEADRIVRFLGRVEERVGVLFIHCVFGEGRAPGAAIAIARAYGLPWKEFAVHPRSPNQHITAVLTTALHKGPGSS